jgi:hypothetical protein
MSERFVTGTIEETKYEIPEMWVVGFCQHNKCSVHDAFVWWHEQEKMEKSLMDPDALLERIRGMSKELKEFPLMETFRDLVEAIDDLDNWITKGGFLPQDWRSE